MDANISHLSVHRQWASQGGVIPTLRAVAVSLLILVSLGCSGSQTAPTSPDSVQGTWQIDFGSAPVSGLDLTACGSPRPVGLLCTQVITVAKDGSFHETWGTTARVRADGAFTSTGVTATLACTTGAGGAGSISATRNGSEYGGTATLSGVTTPVTITIFTGPRGC